MKKLFFLILLGSFVSCENGDQPTIIQAAPTEQKMTIAFGSCAHQDKEITMWPAIAAHNPEVFIWLGDNIYGDSDDPSVLEAKYNQQKNKPAYQEFIKTNTQIIGTWDDHDYGLNDGGNQFSIKEESKALMLDFLDVPQDAEVRNHKGVYQSYTYGTSGKEVKVILLDTRWFRDSLAPDTAAGRRYQPRHGGTVLGETQWAWLKNELENSTAQVHIIGSSIQLISEEHGWEKWANLKDEQQRFYQLLDEVNAPNTIVISGDRHIAEVSRKKLMQSEKWLYDITTSGLSHVYKSDVIEPNKHRVGPLVQELNWALFNITWRNDSTFVETEIRGENDTLYYAHQLDFN